MTEGIFDRIINYFKRLFVSVKYGGDYGGGKKNENVLVVGYDIPYEDGSHKFKAVPYHKLPTFINKYPNYKFYYYKGSGPWRAPGSPGPQSFLPNEAGFGMVIMRLPGEVAPGTNWILSTDAGIIEEYKDLIEEAEHDIGEVSPLNMPRPGVGLGGGLHGR